jgi:hypothetical protein
MKGPAGWKCGEGSEERANGGCEASRAAAMRGKGDELLREKRGAAGETCGCGRGGQEGRENNVGGSHVWSGSGTRIAFFCGIFFKSQNCTLCGTEGVLQDTEKQFRTKV